MEVSDADFRLACRFMRKRYQSCKPPLTEEDWRKVETAARLAHRVENTDHFTKWDFGSEHGCSIAHYLTTVLGSYTTMRLLELVADASQEVKLYLLTLDDANGLATEIFHTEAELQARRVELVEAWEKDNEDDEPVAPRLKQAFADDNADLAAELWEQFASSTSYNNNYYSWDERIIKVDLFK